MSRTHSFRPVRKSNCDLNLGLPNNILHCKNWLSQAHFFYQYYLVRVSVRIRVSVRVIWSKNPQKIG